MFRINTNVLAINGQRNLFQTTKDLGSTRHVADTSVSAKGARRPAVPPHAHEVWRT